MHFAAPVASYRIPSTYHESGPKAFTLPEDSIVDVSSQSLTIRAGPKRVPSETDSLCPLLDNHYSGLQ